jgi:hypothetical protein
VVKYDFGYIVKKDASGYSFVVKYDFRYIVKKDASGYSFVVKYDFRYIVKKDVSGGGNQNPHIEEEQEMQWSIEKVCSFKLYKDITYVLRS